MVGMMILVMMILVMIMLSILTLLILLLAGAGRLRHCSAVDGHGWGRLGPAAGGGGRRPQPCPSTAFVMAEVARLRPEGPSDRPRDRPRDMRAFRPANTFHECILICNLRLQLMPFMWKGSSSVARNDSIRVH